jgi:hypothetical protein
MLLYPRAFNGLSKQEAAMKRIVFAVLATGILAGGSARALLAQAPAPQQPPVTAATVDGSVVKAGTAEPLAGARVQLDLQDSSFLSGTEDSPLTPPESFHLGAITGPDGKFVFANVEPGEYRVLASHPGGYVPAEYGQRTPTGRGISFGLAPGQKMADIQLALTPTSSISGHVYDRDGEPAGRAVVQALRPFYRDGKRALTIVQSVLANDRGEYRLFWLPPGPYYVTAKVAREVAIAPYIPGVPFAQLPSAVRITEPARSVTFEQASGPVVTSRTLPTGEVVDETEVTAFYPGTTEANRAVRIDLRVGANADGVDIPTPGPIRSWRIRGSVLANGQPVAGAGVLAIPRTSDPSLVVPTDRSRADGSFDIAGVVPGSYFLFANDRSMTGAVSLQVGDANVDNVVIAVIPGFRVPGRIVVEGKSRNGIDPNVANHWITLRRDPDILGMPTAGPSFSRPPSADGGFVLEGVPFGDFRVTLGLPGPRPALPTEAYIKSMRMGTADVMEAGLHLSAQPRDLLEIVIGANGGRISGTVVNARREPQPSIRVVAVPDAADRSRSDRYKSVSSDASGRFQIQGLAPGSYSLFAWEDIEEGAWQDPDFLRPYEVRGTPVRIRDGSDENVQLPVIPGG